MRRRRPGHGDGHRAPELAPSPRALCARACVQIATSADFRDLSAHTRSPTLAARGARMSARPLPGDHPDECPAAAASMYSDRTMSSPNCADRAMVVTVVLDGDHRVLPPHVEEVAADSRRRRAPESASAVAESPRRSATAAATSPSATRRRRRTRSSTRRAVARRVTRGCRRATARTSSALKSRRAAERVEARDGLADAAPATDVERRARRRGDRACPSTRRTRRPAGGRAASDTPRGGRAFGQISSTGASSSTHFAPCSADAASPRSRLRGATTAMPPRRPLAAASARRPPGT